MVTQKTKTMWALWLKTSARGWWHVGAALHESEAAAMWRAAKCIPVLVEIPVPEEVRNDDR